MTRRTAINTEQDPPPGKRPCLTEGSENDQHFLEKGPAEAEMAGWHHQLNGHKFEQTPGYSEGQGRLVCCSSWGRKESDMTYSD